jgi:ribonuclease D
MESLMLKYAKVSDDEVRELANRRAQVVRDRLLATGQVTPDRLSIGAVKQDPTEEKEKAKAKASRVDFTLK